MLKHPLSNDWCQFLVWTCILPMAIRKGLKFNNINKMTRESLFPVHIFSDCVIWNRQVSLVAKSVHFSDIFCWFQWFAIGSKFQTHMIEIMKSAAYSGIMFHHPNHWHPSNSEDLQVFISRFPRNATPISLAIPFVSRNIHSKSDAHLQP